ncbi:hypothetical protein YC2023_095727 [Brassica napus]
MAPDGISLEYPLTAFHRNLKSISKQVRLQPDNAKALCLFSVYYSLMLNQNEGVDSLPKFLPVTTSWPRHGNVKVRASDPIKLYASSPNSIVLSASLKVKPEFEIHYLVSRINLAVFRADRARFDFKSMQLRPLDTIDAYASLSASLLFEIHLVSLVRFVEVIADLAVEKDLPAFSLSVRVESFQLLKLVLNSSKSLLLGYFNVVSDYLKFFQIMVSTIQVKIIYGAYNAVALVYVIKESCKDLHELMIM